MTRREWISGVARKATARWLMIVNLTLCINSARSNARILALVVNASLRVNAIRILNAFRSAALVWIAGVIGQTSARARTIALFAYGVCTARRRIAGQWRREDSWKIKMYQIFEMDMRYFKL